MKKQRLRNLTTGRLHTTMGDIYEDLEYVTGIKGIMTHMIPNVYDAIMPWLREMVLDPEYWDDNFSPDLVGEYELPRMNEQERDDMLQRYSQLKDLLVKRFGPESESE